MSWLRRLVNTFRSGRTTSQVDREIAFHLAERIDDLVATGMSREEAGRLARRQFGNPTAHRDETRGIDLIESLDSMLRDVRYALRGLRQAPLFAAVAIGSVGLGIGANAAIFTLIDAVVLRPLPVPRAHELWQVESVSEVGFPYLTNPLWEAIRDRQQSFVTLTAFGETSFDLASAGISRPVRGTYVSGRYFATLEVAPAVGRLLTPDDDRRGCPGVAILGYLFWQREFGGSREVIGRTISLSGHPIQMIGVAPKSFRGVEIGSEPAVYLPICAEAILRGAMSSLDERGHWWLRAVGRVSPNADPATVAQGLRAISQAVFAETVSPRWSVASQREYQDRVLSASPVSRGFSDLRQRYRPALFALFAGVGLILLIACANVANLLLSRNEARQRELAVRLAVGAGRSRLARQLVTESVLLALAGSGLGLALARWTTPLLVGLISPGDGANQITLDLELNGRLVLFTALVAGLTVLVFGVLPALRAARVDAQLTMKAEGRALGFRPGGASMGKALVVAQLALSLLMLVGAGLFVGTLRKLSTVDAGFEPGSVLLVSVDLRRAGLSAEALAGAERAMLDRVRALPGVARAAATDISPISGSIWNDAIVIDGFDKTGEAAVSYFNDATEDYFATMRTRLLAGRDFGASEGPGSSPVAVVNDAWARHFLGSANPLGRRFRTPIGDSLSAPVEIIGVVENAKYASLREDPQPTVYLNRNQKKQGGWNTTLVVRTAGNPDVARGLITPALSEVRPGVVLEHRTLSDQLDGSLRRERMLAVLGLLFGLLAVGPATLGLFGAMSYSVARRRGELGVRIALGAAPRSVMKMIVGEVAVVLVLGLAIGAAAAVALARLVKAMLYGVEPRDPAVYLIAAAILSTVALAAALLPAWRAARTDPLETLRVQ